MLTYGFRLTGVLNVQCLEKSLNELIRRHGSLRMRIYADSGIATQHVREPRAFHLECVDVPGTSVQDVQAQARSLFQQLSDLRLDLSELAGEPPLHIRLLHLGAREHWLLIAVHRLIADCFSVDQMVPELWSIYRDFTAGSTISLPTGRPQYLEYSNSQYDDRANWNERHGAYWSDRLADASSLRWHVDGSMAGVVRGSLGRMNTLLSETATSALRDLARRERTLLATVMLAVYAATVYRQCRQHDFVVPFFVAGRQSEHKDIAGYFSHVLYLRIELTGEQTFRSVLRRVGHEFFRALSHQDFGRMALQKPELLAGNFFQWVTWHPDDTCGTADMADQLGFTAHRISLADFAENVTAVPPGMVDVEVSVFDSAKGIYASGVYRADLFAHGTMQRFMDSLKSAAEQFAWDPDALVTTDS